MDDPDKPVLPYETQPARMSPDGWIVVEWRTRGETIDWFPYRCCECLAEDHLRVLWPVISRISPHFVRLKIPICRECLSRWKGRQQRILLRGIGLIAGLLLVMWPLFLRRLTWEEQAYVAVFVAIGASVTLVAREHTGSPIQVLRARRPKQLQIRFTNRAFWIYLAECDQLKP